MSAHILLVAVYTPVIQINQKEGDNANSDMVQDRVLIDFIIQLQSCRTLQESYHCYAKAVANYGISESAYGIILGADDYVAVSDYQDGFVAAYEEAGGVEADMTVYWSQYNNTPLVWDPPENKTKTNIPERFRKIEEIAADFNMHFGFTLPIHTGIEEYWGVCGLSASDIKKREFVNDVYPFRERLFTISTIFDMHVQRITDNHVLKQGIVGTLDALSHMEIETLKWLSEGYSIKQISDEKLHRSVDSINLYIRNAKKKLNARTRDQLIAKALILKLIP